MDEKQKRELISALINTTNALDCIRGWAETAHPLPNEREAFAHWAKQALDFALPILKKATED